MVIHKQITAKQAPEENPTGGFTPEIIENAPEVLEVAGQTIEQIKRILLDPTVIAEKINFEGHQAVVEAEISKERAKEKLEKKNKKLNELLALKAEKILALEQQLKTISVRLKRLFKIKDNSAKEIQTEIESINMDLGGLISLVKKLRLELEKLPDPEKMLEAYYAKMETMPLTNQEKRELLRPEILTELSTEEYIALWRRLNPHFLTHVTRQGFRDHNAMMYHSGGMLEFASGLTGVLQDGKILRPPMAVREGLLARDDASVKRFIEKNNWILQAETEEEAKKRLNNILNDSFGSAPKYPDETAVHFAAQIALNTYYGGEKSNEVFFLYPSDVLASQHNYAFNGTDKDFTQPQDVDQWNDVFIWPLTLDNPGIPIDAGIVFLPENTLVDSETGSKYASEVKVFEGEEKRVMIEDEKLISAFVEWAENLTDESPVIKAYKEYTKKVNEYSSSRQEKQKDCFDVFRSEIVKLGFDEEAAMNIIYKIFNSSADGISQYQSTGAIGFGDTKKDAALLKLRSASANWKRAENTITAKQYWEAYFIQHPERKPKHIVFYDGPPTTAIHEFQTRHNIGQADVSGKEGALLGFEANHIEDMKEDPRANRGYDELVEIANKIIAEHYSKKE